MFDFKYFFLLYYTSNLFQYEVEYWNKQLICLESSMFNKLLYINIVDTNIIDDSCVKPGDTNQLSLKAYVVDNIILKFVSYYVIQFCKCNM